MAEAMAKPVADERLPAPAVAGREGLPDLKEERRFWAEDFRLMAGRACSDMKERRDHVMMQCRLSGSYNPSSAFILSSSFPHHGRRQRNCCSIHQLLLFHV